MTKTLKRTSTRPTSSKLDRAMAQMAIGTPNEQSMRVFFSVLCQCPLVLTDTVPTAAIDTRMARTTNVAMSAYSIATAASSSSR